MSARTTWRIFEVLVGAAATGALLAVNGGVALLVAHAFGLASASLALWTRAGVAVYVIGTGLFMVGVAGLLVLATLTFFSEERQA